ASGRPLDATTSSLPAVAVNPTPDDVALEVQRFEQKVEAGAKYAITQIVFDLEPLDRFAKHLGGKWPIPILVEIFPLTSHRLALRLHNEVPGIIVPEALQNALQDAGANAAELGFAHARRLVEDARRFAGVCFLAPVLRPLRVLERRAAAR